MPLSTVMAVSEAQLLNNDAPISLTELGMMTLLMDEHPENANELMTVTESGMTRSTISVPFKNR